jgi:hypothetical protein
VWRGYCSILKYGKQGYFAPARDFKAKLKYKTKAISNKLIVLYIYNNGFGTKTKGEGYTIGKRTIIKQ